MNTKIKITLSGEWVLSHREDEILPIELIKSIVIKSFSDSVKVEEDSFTEIILVVKDGVNTENIYLEIRKAFNEHYGLKDDADIISVSIDSEGSEKSGREEKITPPKEDGDDESLDGEIKSLLDFIDGGKKDGKTVETESKEPQKTDKEQDEASKLMGLIDGLVGAKEFKALAKELKQIAPVIIENKTYDTVKYQSYLFSVNDGYGLTTYLSLFSSLLNALGIAKTASDVKEIKLDAPDGENMSPFENAQRELGRLVRGKTRVICIDISEWMNHTNGRPFKKFLAILQRAMSDFIVIFRIPFVDKEVLDKVRASLNDQVFVRTVSFPPLTQKEIQQYAVYELEAYGFKMSVAAWECFHGRITEEKSDGKFYGLNTIRKVVRELLYKKQLNNAQKGKNDRLISKKDALAICSGTDGMGLSGYDMLSQLVASDKLKERINEIISQIMIARSNATVEVPCIHMRFVGNPGTGKTTVARIVGKILKEKGVLRVGNFYEYSGRDFCGRYIGETAPKTASMCRDAYGSVLFIDEAYSLYKGKDNPRDYGTEALDTLIAEMENHRSDLVVIMAGYTDEMETLMEGNAGLASRMPYVIEFPNFTREQLADIFESMVSKQFKGDEGLFAAAREYFMNIPDGILNSKEFSNARFVRNLFERTWAKAAMRCQLEGVSNITLIKDDFERSVADKEFSYMMQKKTTKIGF